MLKSGLILGLLLVIIGCVSPKIVVYKYVSSTMSGMVTTTVTPDSIIVQKNGRSQSHHSIANNIETWKSLQKISKTIEVNGLDTLKSPSNRRAFDGASHAAIWVYTNDSIYKSASFDGGNPNEKIKTLVDSIVQISKPLF